MSEEEVKDTCMERAFAKVKATNAHTHPFSFFSFFFSTFLTLPTSYLPNQIGRLPAYHPWKCITGSMLVFFAMS